jgi:hypothetical protein
MSGMLTPWDGGIRFETDDTHVRHLVSAYPIVRWTDRWGHAVGAQAGRRAADPG